MDSSVGISVLFALSMLTRMSMNLGDGDMSFSCILFHRDSASRTLSSRSGERQCVLFCLWKIIKVHTNIRITVIVTKYFLTDDYVSDLNNH